MRAKSTRIRRRLVSPDLESGSETYREKYKVRPFKKSLHAEYNGFNRFELQVAETLDTLQHSWCRNPVGKDGYKIPIQELGAGTTWFYPDFLVWTKQAIFAVDPKGRHLLEHAVAHKLLDLSSLKGVKPSLRVVFILQGSYSIDNVGAFSRNSTEGFTLVKKTGVRAKALHLESLTKLLKTAFADE